MKPKANRPERWAAERENELREMWGRGDSARVIGERFGITRNAVLGKVHRMGLPDHPRGNGNAIYSMNDLADKLADGGTVRGSAKDLGIPYDAAKRMYRRMIARLGWQAV